MNATITAAIVTALAALIIGVLNLCFNIYSHVSQKRQMENHFEKEGERQKLALSAKYITDKRVDWIQELRETVAEYIMVISPRNPALSKIKCPKTPKKAYDYVAIIDEQTNIALKLRSKILLLLNVEGITDQKVIVSVEKTYDTFMRICLAPMEGLPADYVQKIIQKQSRYIKELIKNTQICLKFEWNRVKKEACGDPYSKADQQEDMKQLFKDYEKNDKEIIQHLKKHMDN